jgi:hypothetical protein
MRSRASRGTEIMKLMRRQEGLILPQVKSTSPYGNISLVRSINESVWQYQFDVCAIAIFISWARIFSYHAQLNAVMANGGL